MFFSKYFTSFSLKGITFESFEVNFGVVFINRHYFTAKFFIISISDNFQF